MKYRTIVADPPWRYEGYRGGGAKLPPFGGKGSRSVVPYKTLTVDEIASLPVREWTEDGAHLYLWTTNTHIFDARSIAEAWGFRYSTLLVWSKPPRGFAGFPTYQSTTEFVLFCRRGTCAALSRMDRSCFDWPRGAHSAKPEAFLDMVESVSPGPYLEMFSRRARLGWDTWGDEALHGCEVTA